MRLQLPSVWPDELETLINWLLFLQLLLILLLSSSSSSLSSSLSSEEEAWSSGQGAGFACGCSAGSNPFLTSALDLLPVVPDSTLPRFALRGYGVGFAWGCSAGSTPVLTCALDLFPVDPDSNPVLTSGLDLFMVVPDSTLPRFVNSQLGPAVQKAINTNPRLNIKQGVSFLYFQMLFKAGIRHNFRLKKLNANNCPLVRNLCLLNDNNCPACVIIICTS